MENLSPLEKEIVILVAQGHRNREIAQKLSLAEQTIRNYLSEIYAKVDVKNRAGLTTWFWQREKINLAPKNEEN